MQMRIKKRPSITKNPNKQKMMNMTVSTALFPTSQKQLKQLPPIKRNLRKPLQKLQPIPKSIEKKERKQTQTTMTQSTIMLQSYFNTMNKFWVKPSDYLNQICQLNLLQTDKISTNDNEQKLSTTASQKNIIDPSQFEIKLTDKLEKNIEKINALFELTQKWVDILKRALFYVTSKKANSQKLSQQIRFWRLLSKKYDELEYQFNNDKVKKLYTLMKTSLKTKIQYKKTFEQFQSLKQKVINKSIEIKKLYLTLEEIVSGLVIKVQQSSCISQSIDLYKKILLCFSNLPQGHQLIENRLEIIYRKILMSLEQKLIASPIYPKQLANISGLKYRYEILDKAMSFYSNFLSILEELQQEQNMNKSAALSKSFLEQFIGNIEYKRSIISNLLQILYYFQYLYKRKQVLEFSKLSTYQEIMSMNIFEKENQDVWSQYMEIIRESMQKRKYQP